MDEEHRNKPTIIQPSEPRPQPTPAPSDPAPQPSRQPTASLPPEAALAHSLHQISYTQTVASRIPGLKSSALIVLGFVLFAALQTLAMQSVLVSVLGAHGSGGFTTITSALSWLVTTACIITLLTTKNTATAKGCLMLLGVVFAWLTITDLLSFSIIALAIDGVILLRTFEFYQSVEALEL